MLYQPAPHTRKDDGPTCQGLKGFTIKIFKFTINIKVPPCQWQDCMPCNCQDIDPYPRLPIEPHHEKTRFLPV